MVNYFQVNKINNFQNLVLVKGAKKFFNSKILIRFSRNFIQNNHGFIVIHFHLI